MQIVNPIDFTEVSKNLGFPFKWMLLFFLPTQYNVENQRKLQAVVFNIVWGGWGGGGVEVRQVKLYSPVCRVRKSAKSANLSQDFCPRL